MRQSASPTDASENRVSSGGVSCARAIVMAAARSGPNQGFARAPFTGLRVVATRSAGLTERSEASKRAPVATRFAHPPSANTEAADVAPRSTARRETAVLIDVIWWIVTRILASNGAMTTPRPSGSLPDARSRQDQGGPWVP
jgi:hypothetical protein